MALLDVQDLRTYFYTMEGVARAVDGVSFCIQKNQTLGMVGESGCGKTITSLSILRLIPEPPGKIVSGSIKFKGRDLLEISKQEMRRIRGNQISMIFQEPMSALNPVYTIGNQISEVLRLHRKMNRNEARDEVLRLLNLVKIPEPARRAREYPHQLSGGMRQRAMIAMALACQPDLLIADEPTTALDVTVQAQILDLMEELQETFKTSILIITHNFGIIAEIADEIVVMYAGMIVEQASTIELFDHPVHPYTRALLKSLPDIDEITGDKELFAIKGNVPEPLHQPEGCRFHPRCPFMTQECKEAVPPLVEITSGHFVRCIHWRKM